MRRSLRKRGGDGHQNVDSLLDTMANVVGILVVVMAFTQLHIGEAVRRIHTGEVARARTSDDAQLRAGEAATREARRLSAAVARRALPPSEREVERLREQVERLRETPLDPGFDRADVVAALLRESLRQQRDEARLERLRSERARLEIRMREAENEGARAVHAIRLPDPRPAPTDTEERIFFCRYGRVVEVDFDELYAVLNRGLRAAGTRPPVGSFAASLLVGHFQRNDIGTAAFRWRLSDRAGQGIAARLEFRRPDLGESRGDLIAGDSAFERALDLAAPATHYLRFHVWSDSFASYLGARDLAEAKGFAVGWRAYDRDDEYEGILQTNVPREATPVD